VASPDERLEQNSISGPSGLLGATLAALLIIVIWAGSTVIAALPASGNPDPGDLNTWATGWFVAGLVGVALVGFLAWAIAPPAPTSSSTLVVDVLAVGAAIAAAVLSLAYQPPDAPGADQQMSALVFLVVLGLYIVGPPAAWWVAFRTRSSGRSLVVVASAIGTISLVTNLFLMLRG
jgi:hypothetical protein